MYEPLPLAMDAYLAKGSGPGNPPELCAVLVISPLISLMEEQTKKLNSKNLLALHIDMSGNYRENSDKQTQLCIY